MCVGSKARTSKPTYIHLTKLSRDLKEGNRYGQGNEASVAVLAVVPTSALRTLTLRVLSRLCEIDKTRTACYEEQRNLRARARQPLDRGTGCFPPSTLLLWTLTAMIFHHAELLGHFSQ